MGEVEAQLVGAHRRARLAHVGAEPLAQRGVQQVGRGVVSHRRVAGRRGRPARSTRAALAAAARAGQPQRLVVADPVDVVDLGLAPVPDDAAGVGDLAAALGVERALLELDQRAPSSPSGRAAATLVCALELLVADEPARRASR